MSRSNPNENLPHPCTKWYEWTGANGTVRHYDKADKKQVEIALPFSFILLDQTSTIKGWSDKLGSGLYSNEVKDTRSEPFIVKAFKGGTIATGLYSEIKEHVTSKDVGGHFVLNCYIAYGDISNQDIGIGKLDLCVLQFKGAALGAWMEFEKAHREVWKKGVVITGYDRGSKGAVVFRTPRFEIEEISEDADEQATALDRILQQYLRHYFKRNKVEPAQEEEEIVGGKPDDDEIPF